MRVVMVSKTFVAETAQRQLEWIARQPGIDLTLITPPTWKADDGRVLPFHETYVEGYQVLRVPIMFRGHYHFYLYRSLGSVLRSLRPDILHVDEEPYNPAAALATRHGVVNGARVILVAWQSQLRTYPAPFAQLEQYNYRHAAYAIAGNTEAANVLRRKGYTGPIATFSLHGVDPEIYRPITPRPKHSGFVVGYIGRLIHDKGVGVLIDAVADLPDSCSLRLVGDGPEQAEFEQLARKRGVADRVTFASPVPTLRIPVELASMDVLVLPSLTKTNWMEQFGRVLVEAMACEVPVVGSSSGEIPRVIGDAGVVVPEGNVEALRRALAELADHPDKRSELAARGRARVLSHFTQEQVAHKTAEVYHEVGTRQHQP